jgi:hypothetical protein
LLERSIAGYADCARNFSWAMGGLPDLAPRGQDHLLASTSVIQQVAYAKRAVDLACGARRGGGVGEAGAGLVASVRR